MRSELAAETIGKTIPDTVPRAQGGRGVWAALVSATATWTEVDPAVFDGVNADELAATARYHGVLPIICQRVLESQVANQLSSGVFRELRHFFQTNLMRSIRLYEELLRIVRKFNERNVAIMPYKGPAFAQEYWGSFSARECADLDFLVLRHQVDSASRVLEELGYERVSSIAKHLRPALIRNASEEQFQHRETKLLLELQWAPAPGVLSVSFDANALWSRARTINLGNAKAFAASPEDLLLLLAIHGWKHNWSRLIWVGDIAQLLRHHAMDWDLVLASAKQTRNVGVLSLALQIAHDVFGSPLPPICWVPEKSVVSLANELVRRMQKMEPCSYLEWHRYMLAARDGVGDRLRQIARFLFTPGLGEYAACNLPESFSFAYRGIRLARVLRLMPGKTIDQ
jgi:hypothetical protein